MHTGKRFAGLGIAAGIVCTALMVHPRSAGASEDVSAQDVGGIITVSWQPLADSSATYEVDLIDPDGTIADSATPAGSAATVNFAAPSQLGTYSIAVNQTAGDVTSTLGGTVVVDTAAPTAPAPTGIVAVAGDGSVTVSWDAIAPSEQALVSDVVVGDASGNFTCSTQDATSTRCTVVGVPDGAALSLFVTAEGPGGSSIPVPAPEVTPRASDGATSPQAPASVLVTSENGSIWVDVPAQTGDGGSVITTFTATTFGPDGTIVGTCSIAGVDETSDNSCAIDAISGQLDTVSVTATNGVGTSSASSPLPIQVGVDPATIVTSPMSDGTLVSFSEPGGDTASSYTVTASDGTTCTALAQGDGALLSCTLVGSSGLNPSDVTILDTVVVETYGTAEPGSAVPQQSSQSGPLAPTSGPDRVDTAEFLGVAAPRDSTMTQLRRTSPHPLKPQTTPPSPLSPRLSLGHVTTSPFAGVRGTGDGLWWTVAAGGGACALAMMRRRQRK